MVASLGWCFHSTKKERMRTILVCSRETYHDVKSPEMLKFRSTLMNSTSVSAVVKARYEKHGLVSLFYDEPEAFVTQHPKAINGSIAIGQSLAIVLS